MECKSHGNDPVDAALKLAEQRLRKFDRILSDALFDKHWGQKNWPAHSTDPYIREKSERLFLANRLTQILSAGRSLRESYDRLLVERMKFVTAPPGLTFDWSDLSQDADAVAAAGQVFKANGVVVLRNALDPAVAAKLRDAFSSFIARNRDDIDTRKFFEFDQYVIDGSGNHLAGYSLKSKYPKTVVNVRAGADDGLIDIFNIPFMFPREAKLISKLFRHKIIKDIITSSFDDPKYRNLNIYYNENVTETRGFHVDGYDARVKIFMYLSDATSLDDGPYCFVLGSHRDVANRERNRDVTSAFGAKATDLVYVPYETAVTLPARAGDIIVSCQHGAHRGYPQATGGHRVMAVQAVTIPVRQDQPS